MIRRSCNISNCAGFSLLEVVVAFAILALALGTLYQIFSSTARRAVLVQEYSHAVLLADSRLTQIGTVDVMKTGIDAGEFDEQYRWRQRVEPYPLPEGATDRPSPLVPYRVTVEVQWGQDEGQRSIALTTVRLGPSG